MPFVASKADGSALTAGSRRTPGPHLPNRIKLFERRKPMTSSLPRRALIKSAAGSALLAGVGMPAVVRGQADAIRIGHLTPLTGFLGPLGEYAVMGVRLAADEINNAGGVTGRKIELVMEDSVNPQTASAKAERLIERDKVAMIIGEISSASPSARWRSAPRPCSSTPAATRMRSAAPTAIPSCSTSRARTRCMCRRW